ncbi:MAG: molybdopterin adenylyltransferase [Verrucomicrobia bacterium]|nr:molybdopterin adenylyltransferase [Verrucomicrobiota bacterium]
MRTPDSRHPGPGEGISDESESSALAPQHSVGVGSQVSGVPRLGVINVSDRASQGVYEDLPGKRAVAWLERAFVKPWELAYEVVPDEQDWIERVLTEFVDQQGCCLILTTGGTGPALRDVTPEATAAVCDRLLPGFGEAMRAQSLKIVPTAILSRQIAGTRGSCLIINLPGKPKAIEECLPVIAPAIPYAIELIGGPRLTVAPTADFTPFLPRETG